MVSNYLKLQSEASTLVDMSTVDRLNVAAEEGDIGKLYELIEEDPYVFEHIDAIPFVETPLHVAASAGHAQFAAKIMSLKPSFGLKLNPQGYAPIHLALQHGHDGMVLHLVHNDKDLIRTKGREDFTPLHFASQLGKVDLLTKFLQVCPDSIIDVTDKNETALHVALKYQQIEALEFLVRWVKTVPSIDLEETILNWKDEAGNTILHIAASNNDRKVITLLTKNPLVVLDAKNLAGQTASDIASNQDIRKILSGVRKGIRNSWKK
ncbi:Ankyrin repeat-containing protein BDA1, partial [Mucuna pruriens]